MNNFVPISLPSLCIFLNFIGRIKESFVQFLKLFCYTVFWSSFYLKLSVYVIIRS
nr:MAG TPA: hypothetical protein [Caudoviricetes sp.]